MPSQASTTATINKNKATTNKTKNTAGRNKSKPYKNKSIAKKNKGVASMEVEVIENLIMMLNRHHKELCDAQQKRYDQLIKSLRYDLVSISNRCNTNNNLACREDQTGSGSPFESIKPTGSQLSGDKISEDLNAKPKTKLVKVYSNGRNFADNLFDRSTKAIKTPKMAKVTKAKHQGIAPKVSF